MRYSHNRRTNIHGACAHGKCVLGFLQKEESLGCEFFFFFGSISFEQHLALLLNYE